MAKDRGEHHTIGYEDLVMYTPLVGPALLHGHGLRGVHTLGYEDQAMYTPLLCPAHLHALGLRGASYTWL